MNLQEIIDTLLARNFLQPETLDTFTGILMFYMETGRPTEVATVVTSVDGEGRTVNSTRLQAEDAPPSVHRLFHELRSARVAIAAYAEYQDLKNKIELADESNEL